MIQLSFMLQAMLLSYYYAQVTLLKSNTVLDIINRTETESAAF